MDKDELLALKRSIQKWKLIERGEMPDLGNKNCDLCIKHSNAAGFTQCRGCPVMDYTGVTGCRNTPWTAWESAQTFLERRLRGDKAHERVADTPQLVELARAAREFLESLLPKE